MSSVIALPAMIVLAIIFCLPILVGVYVYRDAVRRNMSAGLHRPDCLPFGALGVCRPALPPMCGTGCGGFCGLPQVRREAARLLPAL